MKPTELKKIRAALRLTQEQLARRLGVTQNTVARWEIGVRGIPEPVARLIGLLKPEPKKGGRKRKT